jgi:hypothetical protein
VCQALQHTVQVAGVAHVEQASSSTVWCPVPSARQLNHLQQQVQPLSTTGHTCQSVLLLPLLLLLLLLRLRDHEAQGKTAQSFDDSAVHGSNPRLIGDKSRNAQQ